MKGLSKRLLVPKIELGELKRLRLDGQRMRAGAARLKQQLQSRTVLALALGAGESILQLVKREGEAITPAKPVVLPRGADEILARAEQFGQELAAQLQTEGIRERKCVVCIPPGWAFTHSTEVPELTGEDLRGYLELRAESQFPLPLSELRLAHSSFLLPDGRRRVTLAAVSIKRIAAVESALAKAGCKLVSLSLGLDYLLHLGHERSLVHFLANGKHVDVVITAGGGVAAVRAFPTPASPAETEFDAPGFCRDVRIMLGRLPDEIRQGINEAHFGGVAASAFALCEKTREPLRRMGIYSPECSTPEQGSHDEAPAVALAAGERFLWNNAAPFEFVTPEVKRWQTWLQRVDSKQRRWIAAGLAVLVLLPILAMIIRSHTESSLVQEWQGMRKTVGELEDLQDKIRRYRPWFDDRPETLSLLEVIAEAFPETGEAWAKNIQITEAQRVTCTGFARTQSGWSDLLERLRKKPGVSELQMQGVRAVAPNIQFTFTFKWDPKNGI